MRPVRLLFVAQGAGGGIGRAEILMKETLRGRPDLVTLEVIHKSRHPAYLGGGFSATESGSPARLSLRFATMLLHNDYDAIVFSHINFLPLAALAAGIRAQARMALVAYGIDVWQRPAWLVRSQLKRLKQIWVTSEFTKISMRAVTELPDDIFRTMPLALTVAQMAELLKGEPAGPTEPPCILSVTRLDATERYKGVDDVIEAMPELLSSYPNLVYRIIGDGGDRARLARLAEQLRVADHVEFVGAVGPAQLVHHLHRATAFVLPSAKEGFGFVAIEAMAAGCPVIAARAGATPEVVTDGVTGLLVPYGDSGSTAFAIRTLISRPDIRRRLANAARAAVLERFSAEVFSKRLHLLVASLVD